MLVVSALMACGCTSPVACTAEARTSLVVHVIDELGKRVCGANVTARDGSFSAVLQDAGSPDCTHYGISERKGTYTIDVRLGTRHASVDGVKVTADECHVHTRTLRVVLPG